MQWLKNATDSKSCAYKISSCHGQQSIIPNPFFDRATRSWQHCCHFHFVSEALLEFDLKCDAKAGGASSTRPSMCMRMQNWKDVVWYVLVRNQLVQQEFLCLGLMATWSLTWLDMIFASLQTPLDSRWWMQAVALSERLWVLPLFTMYGICVEFMLVNWQSELEY